ncbi:SEA (Seh1-associated) complex subunit [Mycoblastus sanguinarius]|nr:SEA (Seh1-associated) complex subunit [Mycoblastus sanguinarius]
MSSTLTEHAKAPSPPPAPPLPPPRYSGLSAFPALARLAQPFGYGSQPSITPGHGPTESRSSGMNVQRSSRWEQLLLLHSNFIPLQVPQAPHGFPEPPTDNRPSPILSRSTTHRTGIPIAALDISPDKTHAVLAGRDILKTIQVSDSTCAEDFNLRTNIIAYAATHETSDSAVPAKHKDQLASNDVKWSHGNYKSTIATAVPNGQIVVYDINRAGVELARLHEHNRQVHRLDFSPFQPALFLSGSQDATIRLWDLRDLAGGRSVMTCHSRKKFAGNNEGIRDLKWSPTDAVQFGVGTDNGMIQKWDTQKGNAPLLRVNAHEKTCHSIDWHPDGKHFASGGGDKTVKIWNFDSTERRMKPSWQIRAPEAVLNVRWRPACWSSDNQHPGSWQCTQLATAYDQHDPRIHIWDLRRPFVPFRVVDRFETPATALLWRSESLLWSVGSAGMFTQTDTNFATKTMDQRSPNTLDVGPDGKILFFSQKRERRRLSIEDVLDQSLQEKQLRGNTNERRSGSHSATEGSHEEPSLLSSSFKNRQRKPPSSLRSTKSLASTPPSTSSGGPVSLLDISLQESKMYHSPQVGGIGYIEGIFDADAFKFLARHYKFPPAVSMNQQCNLHLSLSEAFRFNSTLAGSTGQYRLAQSWQILAFAVEKELKDRAEHNRQSRKNAAPFDESIKQASFQSAGNGTHQAGEERGRKEAISENEKLRAKGTTPSALENASNMTTPLARPVPDSVSGTATFEPIEHLHLPGAQWSKQPLRPVTGVSELAKMTSPKSSDKLEETEEDPRQTSISRQSENQLQQGAHQLPADTSLADMDRQMVERRAALGNYRKISRPLLRLDEPIQLTNRGLDVPNLDRHDSNESFQLFSASTDSSHRAQSTIGSFESNRDSQKSSSTPERLQATKEQEDYDDREQESALSFDEEEILRSLRVNPASPPNMSRPQLGKGVDKAATTARFVASHRPASPQQPIVHHEDIEPPSNPKSPTEESSSEPCEYVLSDFLPSPSRQSHDNPAPWTATAMFEPLISFHTYKLHDAQLPAYLLLHLAPYLDHSIDYYRAQTILLQYHGQLMSHELYAEAAELRSSALRNSVGHKYRKVADHGLYQIKPGGPWCTECQKPNQGTKPKCCERCKRRWADCPICNGLGPISPERPLGLEKTSHADVKNPRAGDALWGWCQDCGHGGHVGCLRIWWEDDASEGACPTVGCLCDCMPGSRRNEITRKFEEGRKTNVVARDEWAVGDSRAVERARGLVTHVEGAGSRKGPARSSQSSAGGLGGGRGPLSLAAAGRSGSGGKKVRILVPDEQRETASGGEAMERSGTSASIS